MKKQLIGFILMLAVTAGLVAGTKYLDDYYTGMPKDARSYDEYVLISEQSGSPAAEKPELFTKLYSSQDGNASYPIYAFVGASGRIECYTDLQKNSYAYSKKRDLTIPTGSEAGFASLGEYSSLENLPFFPDALKLAADEAHYLPAGTVFTPGVPEPRDIYASDADVTYEVKLKADAALDSARENAAPQIDILESGAVKLTDGDSVSYWRYAFLTGATKGAFFPAAEDGSIVPGALPTDALYIRCTLAGTDTELETEPQTQEAKDAKDALIAQHRAEREEAERIAREEAERKAKEEAERKAKEEAEKKAAEEAAKKKASEKANKQSAAEKEAAKIAKIVEQNRETWTAALKKQTYYLEKNLERYLTYKAKNTSKSYAAVVQAVNCNIDRPFYTNIKNTDMSKGYLILCNKYYALKSNYVPKNLVSLSDDYTKNKSYRQLEKTVASAFKKMADAAKKEGLTLKSMSPYRSYATQRTLYNSYVNKNGKAAADTYSARPGHSEHQTGLAIDINCASQSANFQNTKEYAWLIKNCYKYGFILRYPKGKEYITGYVYEPWHYRYVGVEAATQIHQLGITFEEYYAYFVDK